MMPILIDVALLSILGAATIIAVHELLTKHLSRRRRAVPASHHAVKALGSIAREYLEPCFLTNSAGRILHASESACAHLGYDPGSVCGLEVEELAVSPELLASQWRLSWILQRQSRSFEIELKRRDGSPLKAELSVSLLDRDHGGLVLAAFSPSGGEGSTLPCKAGERFRLLAHFAPTAIFEAGADGQMSYVNRLYANLHGLDSAELLGDGWTRLLHPEDREFVLSLWEEAVKEQREFAAVYRILNAEGVEYWVNVKAEPCRTPGSAEARFVGSMCDITSARDSLEKAKTCADLMEGIVRQVPVAVIGYDRDGRIRTWNPAAEEMFGFSALEVVGGLTPIEADEDWPEYQQLFARVLSGDVLLDRRITRTRKDGRRVDLSLYSSPLRDESGKISGVASCLMDISKQKAIEEELKKNTEELRRSQEIANLGSWRFDFVTSSDPTDGELTWSSQTYRLFEADEESFHPSIESFLQLVHPDDRQNLIDASRRAVESGTEFHFDHRLIASDGTTRVMRERARIERRADGSPTRMMGTVQDVTEQCRLAQRLAQADRMEGIGRLAGGVAHDFNNLMTVINGYAEILWESEPPLEATRRQIEEIRKSGARAAELTNQLLTFSRRQVTQPRVIDLNKAVEEVAEMLGSVIGEDVEVALDLGSDLHQIWMDPTQLNQVLMNLAINGRDAMRHGGTLTFRTTTSSTSPTESGSQSAVSLPLVTLEVEDTGEGIDDSVLPHIFEPFFTTKEQGRGTGLGLSMVYGIVEQAGGEITVVSRLGIGTKFILTLPANVQPAAHCFRPLRLPESVNGGAETVLIVEDQVDVLEIASLSLRSKGYKVLEASSPAGALSICNSHEGPIHLVLTDVVLPGMSGPELAILLKLRRPSVLIIYMSGYAIEAIAERGVIPADVEYVAKPFTIAEIQSRVRKVLNRVSSDALAC